MQYTNSTQMKFLQFGKFRLRPIIKSQISFLLVKTTNATKLLEYELCTVCVLHLCTVCALYVYYMCTACGLPLVRRGAARMECCDARRARGSLLRPQLVRPQRRNSQRNFPNALWECQPVGSLSSNTVRQRCFGQVFLHDGSNDPLYSAFAQTPP